MAIVTRNAIFRKFRALTGCSDPLQVPDFADPTNPNSVGIADYVDSFYNYDFPAQFRSLKLKDKYTFNTVRGIDTYPFNSEQFTTVEMPCYCAKREIKLFNDAWSFYGVNFNWQNLNNFSYGDGTPGPYSGTTTGSPLIRSVNNNPATPGVPNVPGSSQGYSGYPSSRVQNILITANVSNGVTMNVTDDGNGNLIGDCSSGIIDYDTGAISNLVFDQNIPSGNEIQIQYNPVQLSIPLSILFFQNNFTLRPVPDRGYTIELVAYRQPTQALADTAAGAGTPELSEWWECLAFGAAKKRFEEFNDSDGITLMDKALRERYEIAEARTYAQIGKQRVPTIYQDQLNYNYGTFFGGNRGAS